MTFNEFIRGSRRKKRDVILQNTTLVKSDDIIPTGNWGQNPSLKLRNTDWKPSEP